MHLRPAGPRFLALGLASALLAGCGGDDADQPALADVPESPSHGDETLHSPGLSAKPPLGLPGAGSYAYAVTGTVAAGALPTESKLTVEDLQEYRQRWTLERPGSGGQPSVDTFEILANYDGLRLASRTLSQTGPSGPLVVEFAAPDNPKLLIPHYRKPGDWGFDLTSTDGCFTSTTKTFVREPNAAITVGSASYTAYHVEIVSTLTGAGGATGAGCRALEMTSTEKLWLDRATGLLVKSQTVRDGTLDGVSLKADVTTDVRSTTPS